MRLARTRPAAEAVVKSTLQCVLPTVDFWNDELWFTKISGKTYPNHCELENARCLLTNPNSVKPDYNGTLAIAQPTKRQ